MKLPKTKVIVRKKEWGTYDLYNEEKKCFCIMGLFLNQACKIPKETLIGHFYPNNVLDEENIYLEKLDKDYDFGMFRGKSLARKIFNLNDEKKHGKKTQNALKGIFKRHLNCELVFKD